MTNLTLKAATTTQTYINGWKNTAVDAMKRRSDKGQGAIEYVGITILVVAIVVALLNTNLGSTIAGKFKEKIDSVLNG
ncbi:hypothetical protein OG782_24075 [Streptomyces sp. NBC_00876]|uniref:hypothetical protein n=1 Tax=Streptomyces sp. NBC_00876 TaxID=2975853 RepID=UPI0038643158|nr:hypothetical protein OG782_24075 [Streptomyces sp. NBC_00876]